MVMLGENSTIQSSSEMISSFCIFVVKSIPKNKIFFFVDHREIDEISIAQNEQNQRRIKEYGWGWW